MKVTDLLLPQEMILSLHATDKASAIGEMVEKLYQTGNITDKDVFKEGILKREAQTSTALGEGIAMPHAKNRAVKKATILFAKSKTGIDYEALDGEPVYVFFMLAAPENAYNAHLEALAELSRFLMKDGFVDRLKQAETPEQVIALFAESDDKAKKAQGEAATPATPLSPPATGKYVVAVTGCTTGIAHTYLAEEALKKKAAELGVGIKVETNGASGVENRLTKADIDKADGVVIASDKAVEMERFAGKRLVSRPVSEGIRNPEELINLAVSGKAAIFRGSGENAIGLGDVGAGDVEDTESVGKKFYKHLMSGVSQMLPFVIGGGIMIAFSFLIDQALGVPEDQLANLGTYHEVAALFKNVGGMAFAFMLPVLAGYIAYSIAERPGLVAGFLAGSIASSGLAFGKVPFAEGGESSLALTGVPSGFLGALVGGFLAGGVLILLKKAFANLPRSLNGIVAILLYPVLGVFLTGFLMLFVNIPMAAINTALNGFLEGLSGTSAIVLGLILGGMMAIDMGGPINKAAYIFGTGTLAAAISSGGSVAMSAVMAGGMVPPLAIFVATILFKNKFTKEQQNAGLTNIVMGASFITEGAIPFAAADPARAIPSFMVGSAVSGGLVGLFGIKLLAPHGGIFVIALTTNPLLYIISIIIGAIIAGVLFGLLKKKPAAV
jgi:PTS system fructose-specific IIC component